MNAIFYDGPLTLTSGSLVRFDVIMPSVNYVTGITNTVSASSFSRILDDNMEDMSIGSHRLSLSQSTLQCNPDGCDLDYIEDALFNVERVEGAASASWAPIDLLKPFVFDKSTGEGGIFLSAESDNALTKWLGEKHSFVIMGNGNGFHAGVRDSVRNSHVGSRELTEEGEGEDEVEDDDQCVNSLCFTMAVDATTMDLCAELSDDWYIADFSMTLSTHTATNFNISTHDASKCREDGRFDDDCRAKEPSATCADAYVRTMQTVCDDSVVGSCDYTCTPPGPLDVILVHGDWARMDLDANTTLITTDVFCSVFGNDVRCLRFIMQLLLVHVNNSNVNNMYFFLREGVMQHFQCSKC